eukprot:scaffold2307_cov123-Cylindrotheca_fusiformis.AAC.3
MAFRQVLNKMVMPELERDLSKAIGKELSSVQKMTDCFLAPTVHAFQETSARGAFGQTMKASAPNRMVKVEFPAPGRGLFQ